MERVILAETPLTCAGAVDFEVLVQAHARFVFKVANAVLRNPADAEDIVQETFFRAYRSGEVGMVERIQPWLARIAWRLAVDRLRRRPGRRSGLESEDFLHSLPARGPGTEELILYDEKLVILEHLISSLSRNLRETLQLSAVEGTILLAVVIGKDGSVSSVRVLRGLGYGLDESAMDTVTKRWRFKPSTLYGQPVAVQATIEVTFR